jgi:hypothetical protein
MRTRHQISFATITSEGALLPLDLLRKITLFDSGIDGLDGESYHLFGIRLNEAISASWSKLLMIWQHFQVERARLKPGESDLTLTREHWLQPGRMRSMAKVIPFPTRGKICRCTWLACAHPWIRLSAM